MAALTQIVQLEKGQVILNLTDKYGASLVVLGQVTVEKNKLEITCFSSDAKQKWSLNDFLAEKVEPNAYGNISKG